MNTATNITDRMHDTMNRKINSIVNGITTNRRHPTYVTRKMLSDSASELKGMWTLYVEMSLYELTSIADQDLCTRVHDAIAQVQALYKKN
jgi:hypothetical protein